MNLSKLKFTVELSSKGGYAERTMFPDDKLDSCVGVALHQPDKATKVYKIRILIPEEVCKKAQMKPFGFVMVNISDCGKAMQILYEDHQGERFKGFSFVPMQSKISKTNVAQALKNRNSNYLNCKSEITMPKELMDMTRTQLFKVKFADVVHIGKHQVIIDITKGFPLFGKKV